MGEEEKRIAVKNISEGTQKIDSYKHSSSLVSICGSVATGSYLVCKKKKKGLNFVLYTL